MKIKCNKIEMNFQDLGRIYMYTSESKVSAFRYDMIWSFIYFHRIELLLQNIQHK